MEENDYYINGQLKDQFLKPQEKGLKLMSIFGEIQREREKQDKKWGTQNHPSIHPKLHEKGEKVSKFYGLPTEYEAKGKCDRSMEIGDGNWADIMIEEVCEVLEAPTEIHRREEIIQLIAVLVAQVECIDRNETTN